MSLHERVCIQCKTIIETKRTGIDCPSCGCHSFFIMRLSDIGCAIYFEQTGDDLSQYKRVRVDD